ncbi:hypothetical protein JCM8097_005958 [Rhodosporidiobolus ruineniae]
MALTPRTRARKPPAPAPSTRKKRLDGLHALQLPYEALAAFFTNLGRLIATNQTVSLLATALVICSLLSPAIILTFSPSGSPFDLSASAITRRGRGELVWELEGMRRQGLVSSEEDVCWDRIKRYYERTGREGGGRRIRAEQVLVAVAGPRGTGGSRGTIGKGVLHRMWRVQKELERRLLGDDVRGNRCLVVEDGRCATISPTAWWASEDALLQDDDVHRTITAPPLPAGVPVTLSEAFVGIGRDRQGTVKTAQSLVITFFLHDEPPIPSSPAANHTLAEDLARDEAKSAWRQTVRDVLAHHGGEDAPAGAVQDPFGVASESRGGERHVLLKFFPHLVVQAHPRRLENIIYAIGYVLVVFYVSRYIRKLRAHSKMGLLVTGIVELTASGIMSVSICWLMNWSLSLVPWNLLAFLVLTSGLDNMILVLRAIAATDMNLPVPQRMSSGLKSVGVEMTILLLVEEFMAVALLSFVEINVMREWIRFGAVVLVVDYFLELTFFSTVLSIDIQRLELADLLAQNTPPSYQPVTSSASTGSSTAATASPSSWSAGSIARSAWKVLRDRPAKTSTVAFLWFINLLLWAFYGSEHYLPAVCSQTALSSDRPFLAPSLSPTITHSLRLGQSADPASSSHLEVPSGAGAAFWQLINPSNATSVQVYLEPTVSIQFFDDEALTAPESIELLHAAPDTGPSLFTKAMLVVLPIAVVMGLLYRLLLYLLKDAELLQAHWGSEERLGGPAARQHRLDKRPEAGVELLPDVKARHDGDVELIASGGGVVVSWAGLEQRVQVQFRGDDGSMSSFALDIPLSAEPTSLTALAVDGKGRFCAAATARGRLLVWSLERGGALVDFGASAAPTSAVVSLVATPRDEDEGKGEELPNGTPAPPVSRTSREEKHEAVAFFTLHRDGTVVRWDCGSCRAVELSPAGAEAGEEVVKRWLVPAVECSSSPVLATTYKNGRLALVPLDSTSSSPFDHVVVGSGEQVTALALGSFPLAGGAGETAVEQHVVVVGSSSGVVSLFSYADPSFPLASLGNLGSPIRQLRLLPSPPRTFCPTCSDQLTDGFTVLASTRSILRILRVFTPPTPASLDVCTCNTSDATLVPRSRSSSTGILSSPVMSRTLSSGTSSRRFSPRKKPATPTRPPQLPPSGLSSLSDSPLRPRLHSRGANGSYTSSSSSGGGSGASSPGTERAPTVFAPPPPPLASYSSEGSASSSPSTVTAPLPPPAFFDPLTTPAPLDKPASSSPSLLHTAELATLALDDRSGWAVLGSGPSSSRVVVGLRRAKRTEGGGRGWEVWSAGLGKADASFEEGYAEGATDLSEVLEAVAEEDEGGDEEVTAQASGSALRRRHLAASAPSTAATSSTRAVRFSPAPSSASTGIVDLPFSRARPVVSALYGSAVAVGLGDRVVVFQRREDERRGAGVGGFIGL